jgi:cytochrome c oxidase cbb3-type subunit 3
MTRRISARVAFGLGALSGVTALATLGLARTLPQAASGTTVAQAPGQDLAARFVAHPENIQPGLSAPRGVTLRNPHEGDRNAIAAGAKLFVAYNCIDCHGADGSGAMGPSLADGRWHFGGAPSEVFESIYQGRPEGMPAWGSLISPDQIWLLVTYVRSLEVNKDVTTENFTGKTVERTGH